MPPLATDDLPIDLAGPDLGPALAAFFKHQAVASPQMAFRVDRAPDYFGICRLQGHDHRVLASCADGRVLGTMTTLFDRVYHRGRPIEVAYTADLRVAPEARGSGLADRLMREAIHIIRGVQGAESAIVTAVAADNPAGLKKNANLEREGVVAMRPVGRVRTYFLAPFAPIGAARLFQPYRIRPATTADLPAMAALWVATNARKDLARVFTPEGFAHWVETTPGLGVGAFMLAVGPDDRPRAFLAAWSPRAVRRFELASETLAVTAARLTWNAVRPIAGLPAFPAPGEALPFHAVTNLCVPESDAEALPWILDAAFRVVRREGSLFLGLALDERDPLNRQAKRFIASTSELLLLGNAPFHTPHDGPFHVELALG